MQFRARQEMAVAQGLISCLQWHINSHSEMEDIALQMFCALPYVGQRVRSQLWHATGHLFYLELLKVHSREKLLDVTVLLFNLLILYQHKQQRWRLYALEALALWMSDGSAVAPTRTTLERGPNLTHAISILYCLRTRCCDQQFCWSPNTLRSWSRPSQKQVKIAQAVCVLSCLLVFYLQQ